MRRVRQTLSGLLLAAAAAIAVPAAHAAPAGPVPDTTGLLTPWRIEPAHPCVQDLVVMVVRGFVATPCDSFLGAEALDPLHVRIRTQVRADRACFAPPTIFYPVPVPLGRFAAGPHMGLVDVETLLIFDDGTTVRQVQQFRFDFTVAAECGPPPPPGPLPYVNSIGTLPQRPCTARPTSLVVGGVFTDACGKVIGSRVVDPGHVELTIKPYVLPDTACAAVLVPWRVSFDLGLLPAGAHHTEIALTMLVPDSTRTTFEPRTFLGGHSFWVSLGCDSAPNPPPGPLPYVSRITVGREGIACAGDSIPVRLEGVFPSDCYSLRRIELIPSMITIFPPPPPTVRAIVDDGACYGRPCPLVPVPWKGEVRLPPWYPGHHRLQVELAQVTCSDTFPPGQLHRTEVPFAVLDSCPPRPRCLVMGFQRGPGGGVCNATITPGGAAELTATVVPGVALAGLQGEFRLTPSVLRITGIRAIGPAAGMLLDWTPTPEGARFVLFAASGAPIPSWPPEDLIPTNAPGWPVLRVTVEAVPVIGPGPGPDAIPPRTLVETANLLGSDAAGQGVPRCPAIGMPCMPPCDSMPFEQAVICLERGCDFNADGAEDIRDLVLMVHCVTGEGACPPDAGVRFDCDGDGMLSIPDVLCCARHILGRPRCEDCGPDSGGMRHEPRVSVSFGSPVTSAAGVAVPVRLDGSDRIGAAMLTLDLPLERYEVAGFDAAGDWLTLHALREGRIALGMLDARPGGRSPVPDHATFTLRLRLRPGASPGGIVTATGGEFSGPDGVSLAVDLGKPMQALPGDGGVALGVSQPNPFSTETAFTLDLAQPGEATVAIFDLRGRLIATLHRGPLPAGAHVFRWDGRRDDGGAAPTGVYFYRATTSGGSPARKLILMRGN